MTIHTVALLIGLLLAPAWLTWLGHGLRQKNTRTHAIFWGAVIGNGIAIIIMCIALFTPPVLWTDATLRSIAVNWSLLIGTAGGALIGAGIRRDSATN
jgi:hypothetical protein